MFDVIFCRNVFIYFNSEQIKSCTTSFLKHLDPNGILFLGVSETLNNLKLPVEGWGPSVYLHAGSEKATKSKKATIYLETPPTAEIKKKILCVDDSPIILELLKKILKSSPYFEVAGTAKNGLEALELLKSIQVDAITLDLHMPEMDGMQFLKARPDKTVPVVIVSAINRDDLSIAQKALSLGASDYVEKPSLQNIGQATNEIISKLRSVISIKGTKPSASPVPAEAKTSARKKVLIVDDSETIRNLLEKIISADADFEVVAKIGSPLQVEEAIQKTKPDLITLDIHMPEMDGLTLLKKIYPKFKIPIVMISSISKEEGPQVLQALELGAVDYIQKPEMAVLGQVAPLIRERLKVATQSQHHKKSFIKRKAKSLTKASSNNLVLIGASTGGTEAIRHVLESLPAQIPPILIVQHIPAGFSAAFAKRLNDLFPFEVREAKDGDEVKPNQVLIAPGGLQMGVLATADKLIVRVKDDAPVNRHKPSVDYLFRSVAKLKPKNAVAVIMTGMGSDGAQGLKELRLQGVKTIAQDKATCVVFGMPKEAIQIDAAEMIKPLDDIGPCIIETLENLSQTSVKLSQKKTG